jgi:hypothetical protein
MRAYMFYDGMRPNVTKAAANIETVIANGRNMFFSY